MNKQHTSLGRLFLGHLGTSVRVGIGWNLQWPSIVRWWSCLMEDPPRRLVPTGRSFRDSQPICSTVESLGQAARVQCGYGVPYLVMACPILDKIKLEFYDESSRWIFASHVTCITHSLIHSLTHSLDLIECHSIKNMVFPKIQRLLRINRNDSFEAWLGIPPNLNRGTTISLRGQELAEPSQAQPSPQKKTNPEVVVAVRMSGKLAQKRGCMVNIYIKGFLNPET